MKDFEKAQMLVPMSILTQNVCLCQGEYTEIDIYGQLPKFGNFYENH